MEFVIGLREGSPLKNKSLPTLRRETFNLNLITIKPVSLPVRCCYYNHCAKTRNFL